MPDPYLASIDSEYHELAGKIDSRKSDPAKRQLIYKELLILTGNYLDVEQNKLMSDNLPRIQVRLAKLALRQQNITEPTLAELKKEIWLQDITCLFLRKNIIHPEQEDIVRELLNELWQLTYEQRKVQAGKYAGTLHSMTSVIRVTFLWRMTSQLLVLASNIVMSDTAPLAETLDGVAPYLVFGLALLLYCKANYTVSNQLATPNFEEEDILEIISVTTFKKMIDDLQGDTLPTLTREVAGLKSDIGNKYKVFIENALAAGTLSTGSAFIYQHTPKLLYFILGSILNTYNRPIKGLAAYSTFFSLPPHQPHPGQEYYSVGARSPRPQV